MLLLWTWTVPILSAVLISVLSTASSINLWSLFFSILIFLLTFSFWFFFDLDYSGFYFTESFQWLSMVNSGSFQFVIGIDGLSLLFITLSTFLMPLCLISSFNLTFSANNSFSAVYFLLTFCLIGCFTSLNLLSFFLFFEAIVPLMFLVIGLFGSSLQNVSAAHYFFIYTIMGSLLMLVSITWLFLTYNTLNYQELIWIDIPLHSQNWLWLGFFVALASNLPLVPFRIWLPQARVEAPVSGSVLLAGILLKLGGYGLISFVFPLFPLANNFFTPLMLMLSLVSLFFAALTALSQTDFNSLIAYSSVSHMAIVTLGLYAFNEVAFSGAIVLMLAHGFSSSGLFMVVSLLYNSHNTSSIKYYNGLTLTMPLFSSIFLIFSLANLALPITMNFLGEFLVLLGLFQSFPLVGFISNASVVLSAAYSLFLYNSLAFGSNSVYLFYLNSDVSSLEFYSFLPLLLPLFFFGVNTNFLCFIETLALNSLLF